MISLETHSTDPAFNLACEEYALTQMQASRAFMLWQNANTIVIGRYQNALAEINMAKAREKGVKIVRRTTGGGAVYHDLGNLNYSFIAPSEGPNAASFEVFARPMVEALRSLGFPAELSGRNDIVIEGKKVSGTAQRFYKGRVLHHGTLLYRSDLSTIQDVLNVDPQKMATKGVQSVKSRVGNICDWDREKRSMEDFKKALYQSFDQTFGLEPHPFSPADLEAINRLRLERYDNDAWTFDRAPAVTFQNRNRFTGGGLEVGVLIEGETIKQLSIKGDFLGRVDIRPLEALLEDLDYREEVVTRALEAVDLLPYLGTISKADFIQTLFPKTKA